MPRCTRLSCESRSTRNPYRRSFCFVKIEVRPGSVANRLRWPNTGSGFVSRVVGRLNVVFVSESSKKNSTSPIR
ncbi:hypothetical protein D3C83_78560 [compost metagenome]